MDQQRIGELVRVSARVRQLIVEVLICAGCGHPGGAFSSVDLMVGLYFHALRIDPKRPSAPDRDLFVLSKGHSSVGLYTVLHARGFLDEKTLMTFRQDGSALGGHPIKDKVPGIEVSTGSLGHGFSVAAGMALGIKKDGQAKRVFVMVGDGECQEGSVWEAAMFAAHYKLDNLVAIVDRNRIQIDGFTEDILALEPMVDKWEAFGWAVRRINGHSMTEIVAAMDALPLGKGRPSVIIADTVKGKGVSFMENNPAWHGGGISGANIEIARADTYWPGDKGV